MVVLTRDAFEPKWPASMKALVMIVHSQGLYLWLAVHDKDDTEAVRETLEDHICAIVGGDFRSRRASHTDSDASSSAAASPPGDDQTLQDYRQLHIGILSFFQINAIFEALNNSAFNPAVFFERPRTEHSPIGHAQTGNKDQQYSLGEFIRSITTLTAVGDDDELPEDVRQKVAANQPQRVLTTMGIAEKLVQLTSSTASVKTKKKIADQLRDDCLTSTVQHDLLRQFMRITATNVLRIMKSRIERCSRVLLYEMLEIAHRQQPLIQTEAPDHDDAIKGVNNAQLRAFIRYFASKMPLIKNIERSLNEALNRDDINRDSINRESTDGDNINRDTSNSALFDNLKALHAGWTQLVHGIDDDLQGLERAIAQERQDQLLREEERVRTEQETIAELARLQEGSRERSLEETDSTVSIASNVIALIGVVLTVVYLIHTFSIHIGPLVWPPNSQTITLTRNILGLTLVVIVTFIIFHAVVHWVVRGAKRWQLATKQRGDRYYYEVDVQLNVPIAPKQAEGLLDIDRRPRTRRQKSEERRKLRRHRGPDPLPYNEYRSSYRSERVSHDETVHKVYVAIDVRWGDKSGIHQFGGAWRPIKPPDMRLYLIYELLFHRPSGAESFLFQSLRVVSLHEVVLTTQQLTALKGVIVETFINQYIDAGHKLVINSEHFDALMTLNMFFAGQRAKSQAHLTPSGS